MFNSGRNGPPLPISISNNDARVTVLKSTFSILARHNSRRYVVIKTLPSTGILEFATWRPSEEGSAAPVLPHTAAGLPSRIAVIGNYLPRQCGIATFTTDLCEAISAEYGSARLFAVPVNDTESGYAYSARVRLEYASRHVLRALGRATNKKQIPLSRSNLG